MPDRPVTPPWDKMVQDLNTPLAQEGFYVELVERDSPRYNQLYPIQRGTPYANGLGADVRTVEQYASNPLYFLKQLRPGSTSAADFGSSDLAVLWVWATDSLAQDTYNATVTYEEDSVPHPTFTREYDIRRVNYDDAPTNAVYTSLTALLSVDITAAGTGYTQATGTVGNATVQFICYGGHLIDAIVTLEGSGITAGAAITITGDGTGGTATARIQPASAVLISQRKDELPEGNPKNHDYVHVTRVYMTLPGPLMTNQFENEQVRGQKILETIQKGTIGSLPIDTGGGVISSEVQQLSTNVEQRTTRVFPNVLGVPQLPPDEAWGYWEFVNLPLLVLDIIPLPYCNNSSFFSMVTNYDTAGGSSVLRKHRKTVSYSLTNPDPDLSASAYETKDMRYSGKVINFALSNVLNDHVTYDEDFYQSSDAGTCFWTEAYDFAASAPTATDFLAGVWVVKSFDVQPFGISMWKSTKVEYWSAPNNEPIV